MRTALVPGGVRFGGRPRVLRHFEDFLLAHHFEIVGVAQRHSKRHRPVSNHRVLGVPTLHGELDARRGTTLDDGKNKYTSVKEEDRWLLEVLTHAIC